MPRDKFSHSDCQRKVCLVCFLKKKTMKNITVSTSEKIRNILLPDKSLGLTEDSLTSWLPTVICSSCLTYLARLTMDPTITFKTVDYSTLTPPQSRRQARVTRTEGIETDLSCSCSVCHVGHMSNTGHKYIKYKEVMAGTDTAEKVEAGTVMVCSFCFQPVGRGKSHICTKSNKRDSLGNLVKNCSAKTRGRVLSSQLKEYTEDRGIKRGEESLLPTSGAPLHVTVGKSQKRRKPNPFFSADKLLKLQNKLGCSDKKIKEVARFARYECGKSAVEPHLDTLLKERNHLLEDDFIAKKVAMLESEKDVEDEKKEGKKRKHKKVDVMRDRPAVFAKDVEDLVAKIILLRNLNPDDTEIQIGIDDGQGQLKVGF